MERIPRRIYTQGFREQAVRLHEIGGLTIPVVAKRLSLPGGMLKNWVYAGARGTLGEVDKNQKPLTNLEMELARVKREFAEIRMKRDLLKSGGLLHEGVAGSKKDQTPYVIAGSKSAAPVKAAERAASLAPNDAQIRAYRNCLPIRRNQSIVDLLLSRESFMNNLSVSEVKSFRESMGVVTLGFNIDLPVTGVLISGDLFVVAGWIIGKTSRAVEISVLLPEKVAAVALVNRSRPDVERAYPVEEAKLSGFRLEIPVVLLQDASEMNLTAKLADGTQIPLAKICFEKQVESRTATEEGSKVVGSISEQGAVLTEKESAANSLARVAPPMSKSARPKSRKTSATKKKKSR